MIEKRFEMQGCASILSLLSSQECETMASLIAPSMALSGGTRNLLQESWCESLAIRLREHPKLSRLLPKGHVAVQCTYFEKSLSRNWLVSWHQDLSIPVAKRVDDSALSGWSEKEGTLFVQAPTELLNELIAVRVHLDACSTDDGPLRVIAGSHHYGRVSNKQIGDLREESEELICCAAIGDALVLRPLLLHASSKSFGSSRRRVLHFVYGPRALPYGLNWQHLV